MNNAADGMGRIQPFDLPGLLEDTVVTLIRMRFNIFRQEFGLTNDD